VNYAGFLKKIVFLFFILLCCTKMYAQDVQNPVIEQQLEGLTEAEDAETEDDNYQQQLQQLRKSPLNLNTAAEADLQVFRWLTDLQIKNLLRYRLLLGKLVSVYELQAIPGWDIESINRTRPFITVSINIALGDEAGKRFSAGEHSLLIRVSQVLEKSAGYIPPNDSTGPDYLGSQQHVFLRYKYQYKNLLQFGLVGDKDAGEQFLKGAQKNGFDFYSMHLFARDLGIVRRVAIGDFTVNLAQGLLTYQSLAFRKSVDVVNIKRQTEIFRPYNSAAESNFHRGAAITIGTDKLQVSAFASYTKVDANEVIDSANYEDYVSSILTSGYHRTVNENADRKNINQFAMGGRVQYRSSRLQLGVNAIHYKLSKPLQKDPQPYNQYSFSGDNLTGVSVDYAYTFRNIHVFGEVASDQKLNIAQVYGLVASLNSRVDFSMLYRNIAKDYNSLYANAFTEATTPLNERGLYSGLSIRPWGMLRLDMYADVYSFPWLRYRVDRPSKGSDYLIQLTWKPNKQVEVYTRFKSETKGINYTSTGLQYHETEDVPRQNWRTQILYKVSQAVSIRTRAEISWYDRNGREKENGFLIFGDLFYKPMMKPFSMNMRLQYFETDGYNSRLYAYENDVLYTYTVPAFSDKGFRGYFNINYDINKHITTWFKIARTVYTDATSIGSGNDEIPGNHKTDYRVQVLFTL
jgi:hypothetical protein